MRHLFRKRIGTGPPQETVGKKPNRRSPSSICWQPHQELPLSTSLRTPPGTSHDEGLTRAPGHAVRLARQRRRRNHPRPPGPSCPRGAEGRRRLFLRSRYPPRLRTPENIKYVKNRENRQEENPFRDEGRKGRGRRGRPELVRAPCPPTQRQHLISPVKEVWTFAPTIPRDRLFETPPSSHIIEEPSRHHPQGDGVAFSSCVLVQRKSHGLQ